MSSRDDDRRERRRYEDEDRGRGRDRDDDRTERRRSRDDDDDRGSRRGGGRRFEYEARDDAETKRRGQRRGGDFDRLMKDHIKVYTPRDGDNRVRILPPTWKGAKHYGLDVHVHYGVGPDRGSYLCLQKMKGEPDPIAEEHAQARRDGDDEYAKKIEAKARLLVYLIDRDNEKEGVQAWFMPWTMDRDISQVSQDKDTGEVLRIDHPDDGYDVLFTKTGTKDRTKYGGIAIARRSSPLGKDEWLDFAMDNPLPDQLQYYSYDHIAKAFGSGPAPEREDDERERGRDRDDDRGGRSRERDDDRGRSREREDDRGRGRDRERDEDRGRSRGGRGDPDISYESVQDMTERELEDLIDQERLDINPKEAKDAKDLADWVCEEMKLKPSERKRGRDEGGARRRVVDEDGEDQDASPSERLRRMREGRD